MKVIDLLNKIANGEMPKKIKYDDIEFVWDISSSKYLSFDYEHQIYFTLNDQVNLNNDLNDLVEIIEDTPKEDKKIEKLGAFNIKKFYDDYPETANFILEIFKKQEELIDKVNGDK